jgi:hypothetical protein
MRPYSYIRFKLFLYGVLVVLPLIHPSCKSDINESRLEIKADSLLNSAAVLLHDHPGKAFDLFR